MAEPKRTSIRPPAVAGRFYPADPRQCRTQAQGYLRASALGGAKKWLGGVVPHAGWICSGAIAGETIATIARGAGKVDVVVVFGAIHTPVRTETAALDSHQKWAVPGGESEIGVEVERRLQQRGNLFVVDDRLHQREHAVEVNVPMLQLAFPAAQIVPVEVPVVGHAELIGRKTAQSVSEANLSAIYLASSDFTHYGPAYGFAPVGVGTEAMAWAKDNDRRVLDLITSMRVDRVIPEVVQRHNACGGGAIAAMLAACRESGASEAMVLTHSNSYEVLAKIEPQEPTQAVGYASVVVG